MTQGRLFPNICPCWDDNKVKCEVDMTDKEVEDDGMCSRCADGLFNSFINDGEKFIIKNPKTREY